MRKTKREMGEILNVRLSNEMLKMLDEYCKTNNYTRSDVIRWGILLIMSDRRPQV